MTRSKIYKFSAFGLLAIMAIAVAGYLTLSNRHKAIVKTTFLHKTGLLANNWNVAAAGKSYQMISPEFLIDGIYKSMEGPKASNYVRLSADSSLLWITGFHVKALDKDLKEISNDYVCHTNVDFNDVKYYGNFKLENRIGSQYPRMTSLSHGLEDFDLPKGYGIPMIGSDLLFVTTQALNHNNHENKVIRHEVSITYREDSKEQKPLMSRTAFIMLPYDKDDPYKSEGSTDQCIPVETKNHSYDDGKGNMMSGHWVIPVGKNTYRSLVSQQLEIRDSLRLHAAAIHVHPFATSITLFDKTNKKEIFSSRCINHNDRTGLSKVEPFVSEEGQWLYADHQYEIVLTVNNTTSQQQDMMGSMFLFFYDKELDGILKEKRR